MSFIGVWKKQMSQNSADELVVTPGAYDPTISRNTPDTEAWQPIAGGVMIWTGSQAEGVVSEAIRATVSAVAVFKPGVVITGERIRINAGKEYTIIDRPDSISYDNEIQLIALKLISGTA